MTRIGVMSVAHVHAGSYLEILGKRPDVELMVVDPDRVDSAAELARKVGADAAASWDRLFAWKPDAVLVTSENVHHRRLVELAAAHGAHVLCEKPIATTRADALAIIHSCRQAQVGLMIAFPIGFSPEAVAMRALVESGDLGRVIAAIGTNNGQLPTAEPWFAIPELSGGGALVDHVVHLAELIDAALGASAATAFAQVNRIMHAERTEAGVETGALVTIRYSDGLLASIDASWSQPDHAPSWGGLTLELVGTSGNVLIDPFASALRGFSAATRRPLHLPYGTEPDALMLDAFLAAVHGERAFAPDGYVGLRTLDIVLAAQESARTGQPVSVVSG